MDCGKLRGLAKKWLFSYMFKENYKFCLQKRYQFLYPVYCVMKEPYFNVLGSNQIAQDSLTYDL